MATAKQIEALRWLISKRSIDNLPANVLMHWYEERYLAEERKSEYAGIGIGTNRRHAWRRTSGRVMEGMVKAGLLAHHGMDRYSYKYKITEAGLEAARG